MSAPRPPVAERRVEANGLGHHVVEWEPAGGAPPRGTFVLSHGFLDFAWAFRDVGEGLARAGFRAAAFDWRGHGETEWVGAGGGYHFADYLVDLDALLPALAPDGAPVHLAGHSMGGVVSSLFAGIRGDRVASLALLEGAGPPPSDPDDLPRRLRSFLDGARREARRRHRPMADLDEALRRMRVRNPDLPDDPGRFLAAKATRPADAGEGLVWRFDPLHRTTSANPIPVAGWAACARRIEAPTLVVRGTRGLTWPDEGARIEALAGARQAEIPDAGHMMHWQAPEAVVRLLVEHAAAAAGPG